MAEERDVSIGVVIVAYKPDLQSLQELVRASLRELNAAVREVQVFVWDNSPLAGAGSTHGVEGGQVVVMGGDGNNLGFGAAINKVIEGTGKDWYVVLNQDLRIGEGALTRAAQAIRRAGPATAVLELAHRPYEHPKEYDPVSLETPWFSGAAFCVSREAFLDVGGFDGRLFMYGEDVDLSIRLRSKGKVIRYLPDCIVFHDDLVGMHGQKPLQEVYDRANNILLRLKHGSALVAVRGILWLLGESLYFFLKGRRIAVHRVLSLVVGRAAAFRADCAANTSPASRPQFDRWRYCRHRPGGRYAIEAAAAKPKVSIVIRTMNRPAMLAEAIKTAWNQTYGNVELVVVDDGEGQGRQIVENLPVAAGREAVYVKTGGAVGRAAAGNLGLAHCSGEFICFLDEDDQLYADHVEVLVAHAVNNGLKVSYALAEEITSVYAADGSWTDGAVAVPYRQEFSRVLLWYKNFLPIQSVLFARSLYEELGGFDEALDLYEDWSLWVKYSTKCDFGFVPKVTSRYRIFTGRTKRSAVFGDSYARVASTHDYPGLVVSPVEFRRMVAEYIRYRGLLCLTREQLIAAQARLRALFRGRA
ncbi:glycosyltransferase [Aromatoleum toluvorans]|uniref:Glycosyltransferase n=1 Tax=Aromatoleum toluvorans TaxID=92002 RepID=A0ABX1PZ46_9RHOO|nr:glycosyltransferase family 2 protein [Aromatoleum toluvorans]NMG44653.1 glycosyltransferase [Aromatoleum toluvorans]